MPALPGHCTHVPAKPYGSNRKVWSLQKAATAAAVSHARFQLAARHAKRIPLPPLVCRPEMQCAGSHWSGSQPPL